MEDDDYKWSDRVNELEQERTKLLAENHALTQEIARLKAGQFTEGEFQDLCHDKFPCTREEFEQGCKDYQDKLFGSDCSEI